MFSFLNFFFYHCRQLGTELERRKHNDVKYGKTVTTLIMNKDTQRVFRTLLGIQWISASFILLSLLRGPLILVHLILSLTLLSIHFYIGYIYLLFNLTYKLFLLYEFLQYHFINCYLKVARFETNVHVYSVWLIE